MTEFSSCDKDFCYIFTRGLVHEICALMGGGVSLSLAISMPTNVVWLKWYETVLCSFPCSQKLKQRSEIFITSPLDLQYMYFLCSNYSLSIIFQTLMQVQRIFSYYKLHFTVQMRHFLLTRLKEVNLQCNDMQKTISKE